MADIFTKTLDAKTTLKHMSSLGLRDVGVVACLVGLCGFKELFMSAIVGKQHMSLLERYQLLPFKKWLVVEFCAPVRPNMQIASEGCAWVGVITVSELDDGSSPATVESIRFVPPSKGGFYLPLELNALYWWIAVAASFGCFSRR